jgi:hypothetical protein
MKIHFCPLSENNNDVVLVLCPRCHHTHCHSHGSYQRKGFNTRYNAIAIPISVPRYRCLNKECPCCTFSVPPPMVMRYSRFFWPCLLSLQQALSTGSTIYHQARHVWCVGWGVIRRAKGELNVLTSWVERLHRELTDGKPQRDLALMVKIITGKIGRLELIERWYRHRYPLRFQ